MVYETTRHLGPQNGKFSGNRRKIALLAGVFLLAIVVGSCRKHDAPREATQVRPVSEAIAEAEKLYSGRKDLIKVRQGLIVLRQAQVADPSNYELAWRLAKFDYYLGSHSSDSAEQEKTFRDGIEAGKLAVQLQDEKPEGHFWLGANYGGYAEISTLAGLTEIDDIKHEMETVIKLDEGYEGGSAYLVLGEVYLESPRILGGDVQKAIQNFERGLKIDSNNAQLHLNLAKAYLEVNRKADAQKQIDTLLTMKADPGYEPELEEAVDKARELQEKLK